jgi:tRNA-dihydrouridine synthase A
MNPEQRPEPAVDHRFSVAPMLDWTDRHARFFHRLLSRHSVLYTEMVTCGAIIHGDTDRHLCFDSAEHPVVLQLGGSDPKSMAQCAAIAERYGYDEININVGCPSDRVQSGSFGACLMATPTLVAECISAMRTACSLPVTIKCRVGIDDQDSDDFLQEFIETTATSGSSTYILHARIAVLQGLSPKENREIPPLQYDRVYRMKAKYPDLNIIINGGIKLIEECSYHLTQVDGVMMGREAYQNPYLLAQVDHKLFNAQGVTIPTRAEIVERYLPYIAAELAKGTPLHHMTRHILGLYKGEPGGRLFRRHLSDNAWRKGADIAVLEAACALAELAIQLRANQTIQLEQLHD